jgi:hypothetical protein
MVPLKKRASSTELATTDGIVSFCRHRIQPVILELLFVDAERSSMKHIKKVAKGRIPDLLGTGWRGMVAPRTVVRQRPKGLLANQNL